MPKGFLPTSIAMTALLIYLKHHCTWLWCIVEKINGVLFALLYPSMEKTASAILSAYTVPGFRFALMQKEDIPDLSHLLQSQPDGYTTYFSPHPFDERSLNRLLANRSFVMMKAIRTDNGQLAGYFFLRCFFIGKAFHGLLTDSHCTGKGLGTAFWYLSARICQAVRLHMFATVSKHNTASLASARKGTDVRIVKHLPDDYLLIECRPNGINI